MKSLIALKKSHNFYFFMSVGARKSKRAQLDDPNGNQFWILRENRTPDFGYSCHR